MNEIIQHCSEQNSTTRPSPKWWGSFATVKLFIERAGVGFKSFQGRDTVLPEQNAYLYRLFNHLKGSVDINDPLSPIEVLALARSTASGSTVISNQTS